MPFLRDWPPSPGITGRFSSFVFSQGLGWGPNGDQALRLLPSLGRQLYGDELVVRFTLLMGWACSWLRAFGYCSIRLGHLRGDSCSSSVSFPLSYCCTFAAGLTNLRCGSP